MSSADYFQPFSKILSRIHQSVKQVDTHDGIPERISKKSEF